MDRKFESDHTILVKTYQDAEIDGNFDSQLHCLKKLTQIYLAQKQYDNAAKLANAALSLCENTNKNNSSISFFQPIRHDDEKDSLIKLCCQIESECNSGKLNPEKLKEKYIERKKFLIEMRQVISQMLASDKTGQEIAQYTTHQITKLITGMIDDCFDVLGKPLCEYAIVGLGSMSVDAMMPYSDLEFAILIGKDTPNNKDYFRKFTKLLEIKVINLCETECKIEHLYIKPPFPLGGFSFDIAGKTPLGIKDVYELIDTPRRLARFQTPQWFNQDVILSNVLKNVCLISGNEQLVEEYQTEINKIFDEEYEGSKLRKYQALSLMDGDIVEFEPRLDRQKEKHRCFIIKKELYRLPVSTISNLALYHKISAKTNMERLDELCNKKLITSDGKVNIKKALDSVLLLRVKAQLHYHCGNEVMYHESLYLSADIPDKGTIKPYLLDKSHIKNIYRVLLPLYKALIQFHNTKGQEPYYGTILIRRRQLKFNKDGSSQVSDLDKDEPYYNHYFYNLDFEVDADISWWSGEYEESLDFCNKALALDPDNADLLFLRGMNNNELNKYNAASIDFEEAIKRKPDKFEFKFMQHLNQYEMNKDYDQLLVYIKEIINESIIKNERLVSFYVEKLIDANRWKEAQIEIGDILKTNPNSIDALLYQCKILFNLGDYQEVLRVATRIKKLPYDPDQWVRVHLITYDALIKLGKYNEALTAINNASIFHTRHCSYARLLVARASLLNMMGDNYRALSDLFKSIERDKNQTDAYLLRARIFIKLNSYDDALIDCDTLLKINPKHQDAFILKAFCQFATDKDTNDIVDNIGKSLEFACADREETHMILMMLNAILKEKHPDIVYSKSIKICDSLLKSNSENTKLLYTKAAFLKNLKMYKEALNDCEKYEKSLPNDQEGLLLKARLLVALERCQEAQVYFERCKAVGFPSKGEIFLYSAINLYNLGRYEEAKLDAECCLENEPNNQEAENILYHCKRQMSSCIIC